MLMLIYFALLNRKDKGASNKTNSLSHYFGWLFCFVSYILAFVADSVLFVACPLLRWWQLWATVTTPYGATKKFSIPLCNSHCQWRLKLKCQNQSRNRGANMRRKTRAIRAPSMVKIWRPWRGKATPPKGSRGLKSVRGGVPPLTDVEGVSPRKLWIFRLQLVGFIDFWHC